MPPKRKATAAKKEEVVQDVVEQPVHTHVEDEDEHVVLHLPIHSERLSELTYIDNILEYNPNLSEPSPYDPLDQFVSNHDLVEVATTKKEEDVSHTMSCNANASGDTTTQQKKQEKCFWCCHDVCHEVYGMPIRYDALNKNFAVYGTFCSLECASAYNFSQHLGSDRAWEIHSWIQMLGKRFGFKEPIRPAPSRYLLEMFGGPLTIDEFRDAHKGQGRTMILNIPPLISIPSQMEMINTSFLGSEKKKKAPVEKKRTIDTKMKLLIEETI